MIRARLILLLLGATLVSCAKATPAKKSPPPPPRAAQYLSQLEDGIERSRSQMPLMIDSARRAAERVIGGGRLFAGGSQPDFAPELLGRAGGLMCVRPLPDKMIEIEKRDVVLYAALSRLSVADQLKISRLRERGVYVIAFASAAQSGQVDFPPDVLIDSGPHGGVLLDAARMCPTDSVLNIANAWAWTGEFISACTRLGRMPIVYKSYGLQGGHERAAKYQGKTFHDDLTIEPIATGVLGMAYLDHIERALSAVRGESTGKLQTAATWVREATPQRCVLQVMAHMFPSHYQDARAPQLFGTMTAFDSAHPPPAAHVMVVLGYQSAPQLAIDAAHVRREMLLYSSVERGRDDIADDIAYVDPHWPITDACVDIKGYDIPALPASGVVQAATYWALVAEAYRPLSPAR